MHDGLWEVGLLRVLAWTENRCRGFWRIPVSKFQAVDYYYFQRCKSNTINYGGWQGSYFICADIRGLQETLHTCRLTGSTHLLREHRAVGICSTLIKSLPSVLRTTIRYWSIHSSKRSLGEVLHSLLLWSHLSTAQLLRNVSLQQTSTLASLSPITGRSIILAQSRGEGEKLPFFLFQ